MENFSENKKVKRGRPPVFEPEKLAEYSQIWNAHGRTLQNRAYLTFALGCLEAVPGSDGPYKWLLELRPDGNFKRSVLLTELGRIGNPEYIKMMAEEFSKNKPKLEEGVKHARNLRKLVKDLSKHQTPPPVAAPGADPGEHKNKMG